MVRYKINTDLKDHLKGLVRDHGNTHILEKICQLGSGTIRNILLKKQGTISESVLDRILTHANSARSLGSFKADRKSGCSRCGCSLDERTRGCRTCSLRHQKRGKVQRQRLEGRRLRTVVLFSEGLGKERGNGYCAGCGCPLDERTTGCHTCAKRHWARMHYDRGQAKTGAQATKRLDRAKIASQVMSAVETEVGAFVENGMMPTELKVRIDHAVGIVVNRAT